MLFKHDALLSELFNLKLFWCQGDADITIPSDVPTGRREVSGPNHFKQLFRQYFAVFNTVMKILQYSTFIWNHWWRWITVINMLETILPPGVSEQICGKWRYVVAKYHEISSIIIKYLQISSNIIKYLHISSNIIKYHQISSNIIKYHQISSNIIKYHQTSSNIIKYLQISSNIFKYLWIPSKIRKAMTNLQKHDETSFWGSWNFEAVITSRFGNFHKGRSREQNANPDIKGELIEWWSLLTIFNFYKSWQQTVTIFSQASILHCQMF